MDKWQPIETAPKDGTWVFLCSWAHDDPETHKMVYGVGRFVEGMDEPDPKTGHFCPADLWYFSSGISQEDIVGWLPMPDPPEAVRDSVQQVYLVDVLDAALIKQRASSGLVNVTD